MLTIRTIIIFNKNHNLFSVWHFYFQAIFLREYIDTLHSRLQTPYVGIGNDRSGLRLTFNALRFSVNFVICPDQLNMSLINHLLYRSLFETKVFRTSV